ncbi:nucleotide-diphospho-sugar transferase [Chytriomyces sp. MP71]|nr:nucleotide-diphospho-sugar transferase [Chytriomyces sp. MP71]
MDFGTTAAPAHAKEFQAVILAGSGSKLFPLVDEVCPKALLPMANKPMLFYQLEWLESAMIIDVLIVCQEDAHKKINSYIHNVLNVSERYPNTKVEVVKVKGSGSVSADALRHVANRIKTDFIVMSCDTITNYPANKLLDVFRIQSPTFTALFHEPLKAEGDAGAASKKDKDDDLIEYVGIDHSTCRLLFCVAGDEVDDELPVRMSILDKYPVVNIHTKLRDAHLYVFKHWVIDFIAKSKIQSIKEELIPLLTHFQYSERVLKREGVEKFLTSSANFDQFYTARQLSSTGGGFVDASRSASMDAHYAKLRGSGGQRGRGGESGPHHHHPSVGDGSAASSAILLEGEAGDEASDFHRQIMCTAVVARDGSYCFRVNSVPNYLEGNRALIKTFGPEELVPRSVERQKGCQVGDSIIGDSTRIGEKTGIKKSVIGNHCVIGKNVKIINSVLLDHCVIEDKVVLEGTVVCGHGKVSELSNLKDCQIAASVTVEREVQGKNETFMD